MDILCSNILRMRGLALVNGPPPPPSDKLGYRFWDYGAAGGASTNAIIPNGDGFLTCGVSGSGATSRVGMASFDAIGALIPSFGTGGVFLLPQLTGTTQNQGSGLALQADGKIVLGGICVVAGSPSFFAARLNADLSLDGTFGTGGFTTINFSNYDLCNGLILLPSGKIVVVGYSWALDFLSINFSVCRLLGDGTLDNTFGTGGKWTGKPAGRAFAQSNGGIVSAGGDVYVCGYSSPDNTSDWKAAVLKLDPAGVPHTGFGAAGWVLYDNTANCQARALALQADGRLVAAGAASIDPAVGSGTSLLLARFLADGTADATFGTLGQTVVASMNGQLVRGGAGVVLRPTTGPVVFCDYKFAGEYAHLIGFQADGTRDLPFGGLGTGGTSWNPATHTLYMNMPQELLRQADGKFVAGAVYSTGGSNIRSFIARWTALGVFDPTFGDLA